MAKAASEENEARHPVHSAARSEQAGANPAGTRGDASIPWASSAGADSAKLNSAVTDFNGAKAPEPEPQGAQVLGSAGSVSGVQSGRKPGAGERIRRTLLSPTVVLGVLGTLVTVALWWIFTAAAATHPMLGAFSPANIPAALGSLLERGALIEDIGLSLWRLLAGLGIAAGIGIPLGLLLGFSRPAAAASTPTVQFLRMVSPLSWAPIAVVLFGVGGAPVIFLVAMAAVWPITLTVVSGVHGLDPMYRQVAFTLGATRWEALRTVLLPALVPSILAGVRLALGIGWVIIVPAEMLGVSSGLGYEILNARDRLAYDEMLAVILVIGLLGILLDALASRLLRQRRAR